ncbi:MAG TPA: hypothetical protein VGZ00_11995 [Candidatus Baltobacteraceae bacterium]|jgi:hypothetical protein|nr:hypothetical protein [Candidatus Baltobacteraceae bacterium]
MPSHALLIHGYSESSLASYAAFPSVLAKTAPELGNRIALSAFDSLDDGVTIDDLADGLEIRMLALEAQGWKTNDAAVICHSTGALVARRWMLNRLGTDKPLPTHFISMAGANHGSSLAQMGRTPLSYAHEYLTKKSVGVGARVLIDLDYGSDFLLRLNREWLTHRFAVPKNDDQRLAGMYVFSMGGDSLGPDPAVRLLWASSEHGSDNTVRISGANLNYSYFIADPAVGLLHPLPRGKEPHLIVPGKSHYGTQDGILASNTEPTDAPMLAIREALDVSDSTAYRGVVDRWSARNDQWKLGPAQNDCKDPSVEEKTNEQVHVDSSLLFYLHDRGGRSIDECFIGLLDANEPGLDADRPQVTHDPLIAAMLKIGSAIEPASPIQNNVQHGSYSFYLNTALFNAMEHCVTIEAGAIGQCVPFDPVTYKVEPNDTLRLVEPNEFTYVDVVMPRDASPSYAIYDSTVPIDPSPWRPFPSVGRMS